MKVKMKVREEREVEVCDRCKKQVATKSVGISFADIGKAPVVSKPLVLCKTCCDVVMNSLVRTERPRKAKAEPQSFVNAVMEAGT